MDDLTAYFATTDDAEDYGVDAPTAVTADERRLHVRAYNHWVSLLRGRAFPAIEDIDPSRLGEFSRYGVLLDFTANRRDPAIRYLGPALHDECGFDDAIGTVGEVPRRSLLSRLTDHYLQIIASRSPVGFDAEFVNQRGLNTLYRGILMPFSSNGVTIDFIFGVINWKELADADTTAELMLQMDEALRRMPSFANTAPLWADGPNAAGGGLTLEDDADSEFDARVLDAEALVASCDSLTFVEEETESADAPTLALRLDAARRVAEEARSADGRSRTSLYGALGLAYDFAVEAAAQPDAYHALLASGGIRVQSRAPMTAIAKLVFGASYDKARLTEFATALSHVRRLDLPAGAAAAFIEENGGLKAVVSAERKLRRPAPAVDEWDRIRAALRDAVPVATAPFDCGSDEFVVIVGRRTEGGIDLIAPVADARLVERAMRKAAA
jgi:hypothetical protein